MAKDPRGRPRKNKKEYSTMRLEKDTIDLVDAGRKDGESRDDCIVRVFGKCGEKEGV